MATGIKAQPMNISIEDDTNLDKEDRDLSSEHFKIEISNLPPKLEFHMAKNLIESFNVKNYRRIKVGRGRIYVNFSCDEDRGDAIKKIKDLEYKGRKLEVCVASPREDPFLKRRRMDIPNTTGDSKITDEMLESPINSINDKVCPLWAQEYDKQLRTKDRIIRSILTMYKDIKKLANNLEKEAPLLHEWNEANRKISCNFHGVQGSPVINGYRNKCEFNVDGDGNVGFRLGRYKDGSTRVITPPSNCPIINDSMFSILMTFQEYLKQKDSTKLRGFDPVTHQGHVRQLTVRTNNDNQILVILDVHPQDLSKDEIDSELNSFINLFKSNPRVVSIFSNVSEKSHLTGADTTLKLIYGQGFIQEQLYIESRYKLNFKIGPTSFFQVNTKAAELLYNTIIEIAKLDSKSFVIDFGCGTGTISLSLAKSVSHVIGIEIVSSAVDDAKINAKENCINNVSFFCGKAEDLIHESISIMKQRRAEQNDQGDIIAIVDPPRGGFNTSFIKSIRASPIRKLIYVACDPKANTNLTSLCRPQSKAYRNAPFVPREAKAVDLFPHTRCCELIIVYERLELDA